MTRTALSVSLVLVVTGAAALFVACSSHEPAMPTATAPTDPAGTEADGGASDARADGASDAGEGTPEGPSGAGAHYDAAHARIFVRVAAPRATRLEVHFFARALGEAAKLIVPLARDDAGVWSAVVAVADLRAAGVAADVYYGYRVWGPNWPYDATWKPGSTAGFVSDIDADGNRFNPNKLLFDPYARELSHDPQTPGSTDSSVYNSGDAKRALDSALAAPKGLVLFDETPASGERPTRAFKDDVVYEVHVRGFTKGDPSVDESARGTYLGVTQKIPYLVALGVTALELLPIHETQNDTNDTAAAANSTSGMNYWGYSSLDYFAPDRRFAADASPGGATREFKAMSQALHAAGIKLFLDVVYNHTGEGGVSKTDANVARVLSYRGLDNAAYYELAADGRTGFDSTGTSGNVNTASDLSRALILDSLRYWKDAMGVDGFRFDLAPVLGNSCVKGCFQFSATDSGNVLNRAVSELPVRPSAGGPGVELIAEPWASGPGTYQLGHFPAGWSEWNGTFRDLLRESQNELGTTALTPAQLVAKLGGSPDLYQKQGRAPTSAVNYISSHDGFTLRDVYTYATKSNAQPWPYGPSGGGDDANHSWDQGGDPAAQHRAARTGLALALVSAGVPMITGGDEMYRTQYGNNNPYNLDSPAIWLDWSLQASEADYLAFARGLFHFRAAHAGLRRAAYPTGTDHDGNGRKDLSWLRASGAELDATYLADTTQHFVAFRVDGAEAGDAAASLYVAYNAWSNTVNATLPAPAAGKSWYLAVDSGAGLVAAAGAETPVATGPLGIAARSVVVLVER